jgi:parvulin-like peptidyl-prolyl isomerase
VVRTETEVSNVLAQLRAGAKFDELARAHSTDSSAAAADTSGVMHDGRIAASFWLR